MGTTIRKWGNSLGVRIPSALAEDARLHDGAEGDVTVRVDQLVIVPVLSLAGLVAGITAANLPDGDEAGVPRGSEQW
jgi:antitoxin MazE